MPFPSPKLKQFILRVTIIAGASIVAGMLRHGSFIFISTFMAFQFTHNGITAGLSYALFKRTSLLNSFLVLFCWYLVLTILEDINNHWMFVLNLIYIAGIASVIYLYLFLIDKSILRGAIRRVVALTLAVGIVNTLHVVVLVFMSLGWSWIHSPHFVSQVLSNCSFNFQTGILIGFAVGIGIEAADHSLVQRALSALKSWALDANGS